MKARLLGYLVMFILSITTTAAAEIRPTMRPDRGITESAPIVATDALRRSARPVMRQARAAHAPRAASTIIAREEIRVVVRGSTLAVARSKRPVQRPRRVARQAARSLGGAVCNSPSIKGQRIPAIAGTKPGCGVAQPVSLTEVAGVRLSQPSKVDCSTARALEAWVQNGVKPAVGRTGGGLSQLHVAAHYSCRTRNNRPGAKISEHGKGRAIDISALVLADGTRITVLNGWRGSRRHRDILRKSHAAACGPFGTVLGPEADRYHQDHFHFDVAERRSGPYCR